MGGHNFDISTVQKLIFSFDSDRSGQVGLHEFISMHKYLESMRQSFQYFDQDRSGSLDSKELLQALHRAGYNTVTEQALWGAMPRFDRERKGSLTFAQYIELVIYFGNLRKLFDFYDPRRTGQIQMTFDQVVACTPYFAQTTSYQNNKFLLSSWSELIQVSHQKR